MGGVKSVSKWMEGESVSDWVPRRQPSSPKLLDALCKVNCTTAAASQPQLTVHQSRGHEKWGRDIYKSQEIKYENVNENMVWRTV